MPTDPDNTPPGAADDLADPGLAARALEALANALVICDATRPDHPVVYANPAFEATTGYPSSEILGRNPRLLQGKGTDPDAVGNIREALEEGRIHRGLLLNYRRDGRPFWNDMAFAPVRDASGAVTHWVSIQADVSGRVAEYEALRTAAARLEVLIASMQAGVILESDAGRVVLANQAFCDMMGLDGRPEALTGHPVVPLALGTARRFADPDGFIRRALAIRGAQRPVQAEALRLADGRVWERDYVPVPPPIDVSADGAGHGGHLWVFRDVTQRDRIEQQMRDDAVVLEFQNEALERANAALERANAELERANEELERANARLEQLATTDSLTGLLNQRVLLERIAEEMRRSRRYDEPLALILVDVDRFKGFNDARGHLAGNAALRGVAQALRAHARETDLVARFGGEEFALILPHTGLEEAVSLAERLRAAVAASSAGAPITASFGVCALTPDVSTAEEIIACADRALYRAKAKGRNRVERA